MAGLEVVARWRGFPSQKKRESDKNTDVQTGKGTEHIWSAGDALMKRRGSKMVRQSSPSSSSWSLTYNLMGNLKPGDRLTAGPDDGHDSEEEENIRGDSFR